MLVKEIMNKEIVSVLPEDTADCAARLMSRHNIGALPVCTEDGKLCGIVTDRDIVLRCVATEKDPKNEKVRDIMSKSVVSTTPTDSTNTASRMMAQARIRRLPVLMDGKVVGMVALGDLAVRPACDMEAAQALSEISSNLHVV